MQSYAPLWNTILTSSVWSEAKETRLLWVTLIAAKDAWGVVHSTIPGLARMANLSIAEIEAAVKVLESPDIYSSSPDFEGKRIQRIDGGWKILNHDKYRDKISEVKSYHALRQREYRRRKAAALLTPKSIPLPGETICVRLQANGVEVSASDFLPEKPV